MSSNIKKEDVQQTKRGIGHRYSGKTTGAKKQRHARSTSRREPPKRRENRRPAEPSGKRLSGRRVRTGQNTLTVAREWRLKAETKRHKPEGS